MNKKWEDVYPKQFDIVWARFQGYDDVTYDKIENYHDQRRPYLVLFFKDNLYYCLKVTTKFHCGAFAFGKEYVGPNAALCLIKRTDFTGIKSELKGAGRSNLINYKRSRLISLYSEDDFVFCFDIDNRRIVRFDYINFLTFHVQMIYSLEEKYKHLKMYGGCDERLDAALNSYEELLNQQKRNLKDNNN